MITVDARLKDNMNILFNFIHNCKKNILYISLRVWANKSTSFVSQRKMDVGKLKTFQETWKLSVLLKHLTDRLKFHSTQG